MSNIKKAIFQFLLILFIQDSHLYADWNEEFDIQSSQLIQELVSLNNPDYIRQYEYFKSIRNKLLNDRLLIKQIRKSNPDQKLMVQQPDLNIIIKKRRENCINDLYPWELSYVTGSNEFMLPSFPLEIGEKRVIIQVLEPFKFSLINKGSSKKILKKISLEHYWKALLQAYILGVSDLVGQNVGVNDKGNIRFFDTEKCFSYINASSKTDISFKVGFICQAFDWPQYRKPLNKATAKSLRNFVQNFSHFEEDLKIYLKYRLVHFSIEGLQYRLEKIKDFKIQTGVSFQDFITWIYPKMAPGLDELNQIVRSILGRKVGYGTSLFFVCRHLKNYTISPEEQKALQQWINSYID